MEGMQKVGRLALREKDGWWHAYYAESDRMDSALLIARIDLIHVQKPENRRAFVTLCRNIVADIIEAAFGERPFFPEGEVRAPEHERGVGPTPTLAPSLMVGKESEHGTNDTNAPAVGGVEEGSRPPSEVKERPQVDSQGEESTARRESGGSGQQTTEGKADERS